jgi:hypothetical protein
VDHKRLRFTMDRRHGRPRELTRAQPLATPGLKVTGEGAGEVEEAAVSTFVFSSELGRWGNSSAVERDGQWRPVLGEVGVADSGASKDGGGECGDGQGCSSPFYRGREEYGGGVPVKNRSSLMASMMPYFRDH